MLTLRFSDLFERVKHSLFALLEQQEVIFELDFKAIKIRYIEAYLFSIMRNLISNAIKYSAPDRDCKISLLTEKLDKGILLTIRDNGIGINLEKHGHELFDSFKRFSKQAGGIGLGLYLIRQMVKHNGGSIEVESQLDYGTTFRLYLIEYS